MFRRPTNAANLASLQMEAALRVPQFPRLLKAQALPTEIPVQLGLGRARKLEKPVRMVQLRRCPSNAASPGLHQMVSQPARRMVPAWIRYPFDSANPAHLLMERQPARPVAQVQQCPSHATNRALHQREPPVVQQMVP